MSLIINVMLVCSKYLIYTSKYWKKKLISFGYYTIISKSKKKKKLKLTRIIQELNVIKKDNTNYHLYSSTVAINTINIFRFAYSFELDRITVILLLIYIIFVTQGENLQILLKRMQHS